MATHIGKKIEERAAALGLGPTELAKKLNTTRKNIYNIFAREIVDSPLLLLCCKVLNHDFFQYFYDEDPLQSFKAAEIEKWQSKISLLSAELDSKNRLLETKDELISTLNKRALDQEDVIRLLKEKQIKK